MIKIEINENTSTDVGVDSSGAVKKYLRQQLSFLRDRLKISKDRWVQIALDDKKYLLADKWRELPPELQTDNQILGKHWVGCGYTMGPAYCSFGCSHCYLPKSSNRVPLVPLASMKEQIVAHRKLLGPGGNLQITGGDVVDAYWRAGKKEELIEVLRFATKNELVPMLMTHGQLLLENPDYFEQLVIHGGLRKVSIHIDITMAGRPAMPVGTLSSESQLHELRDQFVDLVIRIRRRTGKLVVAAQTVTVTEKNIQSIGEILGWLMSNSKNMDVCRTISFQPEADVGRTKLSINPVTPELVWSEISKATGLTLARDHLLVGHPDCSSIATLLVGDRDRAILYLSSRTDSGNRFWKALLDTFGGIGASSVSPFYSLIQKMFALVKKPAIVPITVLYMVDLYRRGLITKRFARSMVLGRVRGLNIVMHNFMSEKDLQEPRTAIVQQRLRTCAFKGVVKNSNEWETVSMCEMNTRIRPDLYQSALKVEREKKSTLI